MKRCSFCEWIPILPWPVCPLAGQCVLGQNTVVGSMTILLAMRGNIATRSMSGPLFALQLHRTTVWCGATTDEIAHFIQHITVRLQPGDGVVLYTDGITEAENLAGQQYGLARLCTVVRQY